MGPGVTPDVSVPCPAGRVQRALDAAQNAKIAALNDNLCKPNCSHAPGEAGVVPALPRGQARVMSRPALTAASRPWPAYGWKAGASSGRPTSDGSICVPSART